MKIAFKTDEEFQKWGLVLVESVKSDEELRQLQVIEPMQRQMEEQRRLDELQEIQSRKSRVINERRVFKKNARQLYLGKFMNLSRNKPWDEAEKKAVMEMLEKWTKNTSWFLAEVKGGV